jgi:serine/threonine protein kinase
MASESPPSTASAEDQIRTGQVIDDFLIMDQIGSGAFSRVHVAEHLPTHAFAAVKIVDLTRLGPDEVKGMIREISVFQLVSHRNICSLYRISTLGHSILFFMEFAPCGTLLSLVNEKKGLSEAEAQFYFTQLFAAVRHLHLYHFIAHRDLKLENVMLGKGRVLKLADFGLAGTACNGFMHTFLGTPGFQAPEIVAGNEYNEKCDVWSLGVCLWAMVSARLPFSTQNANYRLFLEEIVSLQYPRTFSPLLQDLLKKMLTVKPEDRPSVMQLQDHPWMRGLEQLSPNIAPQPVYFQSARSLAAVSKMKRRKTQPNRAIITKCIEMGVGEEQLLADLTAGETTNATTTYFVLCNPVMERPPPRIRLRSESNPEIADLMTSGEAPRDILPRLHSPKRGKGNQPMEFATTRPIHIPPPLLSSTGQSPRATVRKPLDFRGSRRKL